MNGTEIAEVAELTVLIGTRNRLPLLKLCIGSVLGETKSRVDVVVIDAGSTDGTIEYVGSLKGVRLVCDGEPLGQAQSLNRVLRTLKTKCVCWISDDNIMQPGALDAAIQILRHHPDVGMVSLKVKDISGGREDKAYIGGVRASGILTCNQGMLPLDLFAKVGFFDEDYRDYGIDVELTARILLEGKKVVFTKKVAIHHNRDHHNLPGAIDNSARTVRIRRSYEIFSEKHPELEMFGLTARVRRSVCSLIKKVLFRLHAWFCHDGCTHAERLHDWNNILSGRYISKNDLWKHRRDSFYLVQTIP